YTSGPSPGPVTIPARSRSAQPSPGPSPSPSPSTFYRVGEMSSEKRARVVHTIGQVGRGALCICLFVSKWISNSLTGHPRDRNSLNCRVGAPDKTDAAAESVEGQIVAAEHRTSEIYLILCRWASAKLMMQVEASRGDGSTSQLVGTGRSGASGLESCVQSAVSVHRVQAARN
ncbi:unnamed protein product, partial [Protopolystoma xenopodis]